MFAPRVKSSGLSNAMNLKIATARDAFGMLFGGVDLVRRVEHFGPEAGVMGVPGSTQTDVVPGGALLIVNGFDAGAPEPFDGGEEPAPPGFDAIRIGRLSLVFARLCNISVFNGQKEQHRGFA